jgi:DNA uptake protein ComE-like DNA-binding protein
MYQNYRTYNDAWLLSLDEEITDTRILKNRQKTYQEALNRKISRAKSEESSLISGEDQMTPENFKEQKIEGLKTTLLSLLETGESPNRAIKRFTGLLPEKKAFKPFRKNVRKNTIGTSPCSTNFLELQKPRLRQQSRSEKKKKLSLNSASKTNKISDSIVSVDPLLGKRKSFEEQPKVFSETSSVSSMNNNSLFDFDKKKLPKHLENVGKSMMDSPSKFVIFCNFIEKLKEKIDKVAKICNILQNYGVVDIYFMRREDIQKYIFKDEDYKKKEVSAPSTAGSFNKPTKKPKIH